MKCLPVAKSIGWFWNNQRKLDFNPIYQREAGAWSLSRKTLFIDSLLNDYDIPKIYLHNLGDDGAFSHAVIDGKQRITTLIEFLDDKFALAEEFTYSGSEIRKADAPQNSQKFSHFTEEAKQVFKDIQLAVTLVNAADDEEIEALFTRLNDGEPLNSAEYRNAFGGSIVKAIRELEGHDFFTNWVAYNNKRFAFKETAARLLYLEHSLGKKDGTTPDLKKANLDDFARDNKNMSEAEYKKLFKRVNDNLNFMLKCFSKKSKELAKQSLPQVYYLWLRGMRLEYAHPHLQVRILSFIEDFALKRIENMAKDEVDRDPTYSEFSYLSGQGTNSRESMEKRAAILTKLFLTAYPDTEVLDKRRLFTNEEKFVIFMRAGQKCENCGVKLENFMDFHADHVSKYAHGGKTTLENAAALCEACNLAKG
jgi:5-methylcytosine-specific restriction endonuclease McrA